MQHEHHNRFDDFDGFIFHDPARETERPWHEVYGDRTHLAGLILRRAYTLAQEGKWDRMCSYLHWELDQPMYGAPGTEEVYRLRRLVQHVDCLDDLIVKHLASANLRQRAGYTEEAVARLGWLLELIPEDHRLYERIRIISRSLTSLEDE